MSFGITELQKESLKNRYLGKKIKIVDMDGEPDYIGRTGECTLVDDIGQLHGTWGGLALQPGTDSFYIIEGQ